MYILIIYLLPNLDTYDCKPLFNNLVLPYIPGPYKLSAFIQDSMKAMFMLNLSIIIARDNKGALNSLKNIFRGRIWSVKRGDIIVNDSFLDYMVVTLWPPLELELTREQLDKLGRQYEILGETLKDIEQLSRSLIREKSLEEYWKYLDLAESFIKIIARSEEGTREYREDHISLLTLLYINLYDYFKEYEGSTVLKKLYELYGRVHKCIMKVEDIVNATSLALKFIYNMDGDKVTFATFLSDLPDRVLDELYNISQEERSWGINPHRTEVLKAPPSWDILRKIFRASST